MPLSQQTFFNASIRGFNCSIGWNSQISTCTVELVEDPVNNDAYLPVPMGHPAYFTYEGFSFGGILQKSVRTGSFQGDPLWQATIVDPREILDGVQLIIEGYTGATNSLANLYNVYGYLETTRGFGGARVNETGIPWQLLRDGFLALNNISGINFRGATYFVDLTRLPTLSADYRIGGSTSISVMEFIARMCEDGACDYYFSLVRDVLGRDVIVLHTVSRAIQPVFGLITDFISNTSGAVAHEIGLELRNEVTSKFLVGGKVSQLYFMNQDEGDEDDLTDDTILPFWGFDADRNMITGVVDDNDENNYFFTLDSRSVNVLGVGEFYETDVGEMRAALGGQASWESYILAHLGEPGPNLNKATQLGLVGNIKGAVADVLADKADTVEKFRKFDLRDLAPLLGKGIIAAAGALEENSLHEENIRRLYNYVLAFAQEYYGRKYIVDLPDVSVKRDDETGELSFSLEPTDGGFLEESQFLTAVGLKLMPPDVNFVLLSDGRIGAYVRFDDVGNLDLNNLNESDFVFGDDCVFIKCDVENRVYFLLDDDITTPKAIITLPSPIFPKAENGVDLIGILRPILIDHATVLGLNEAERKAAIKEMLGRFGGEQVLFGWAGLAITPDVAIIPLQSNILTYGPWSCTGANGAVTFEQDDSLVPWNYGSYEAMNAAGTAKVVDALSEQQVSETGSIEVPGAPNYNIGNELIAGGPYITNINCSIGLNGVTTTYRMETWTQRFGKFYKQNAERFTRMSRQLQLQRRLLRDFAKIPGKGSQFYKTRENYIIDNPRLKAASTATYIGGEIIKNEDTGIGRVNVAVLPQYHAQTQLGTNYENKAFMSLDGLFVPFSTDPNASGIPKCAEIGNNRGYVPTIEELNHFGSGISITNYGAHNIAAITKGSGIINETDLSPEDTNLHQRGLALRGPLVMGGWGLNVCGQPVPNNSGTDYGSRIFLNTHKQRPDKWLVGPVDLRWHPKQKIWMPITEDGYVETSISAMNHNITVESNLISQKALPVNSGQANIYVTSLDHNQRLVRGQNSDSSDFSRRLDYDIYNPHPYTVRNVWSVKNVNGFWQVDRPITYPLVSIFTSQTLTGNNFAWSNTIAVSGTEFGDIAQVSSPNTLIKINVPAEKVYKIFWQAKITASKASAGNITTTVSLTSAGSPIDMNSPSTFICGTGTITHSHYGQSFVSLSQNDTISLSCTADAFTTINSQTATLWIEPFPTL